MKSPRKTLVTAEEASRILGVKAATLYAYVSRGLLRATPSPSSRQSLYSSDDIEQLKAKSRAKRGHGARAASAMRWGEPILDSAVSMISPKGLFYRGHSMSRLIADGVAFERVSELLWSGHLPDRSVLWKSLELDFGGSNEQKVARSENAWTWLFRMTRELSHYAMSSSGQPLPLDETLTSARGLIRLAAALVNVEVGPVAERRAASTADIFLVAAGRGPSDEAASRAVNACMIAAADHELNASTFAARVVASTGASLPACLIAAFGALSGPRHGATVVDVTRLLEEMEKPHDARKVCRALMSSGRAIPGFGHALYPDGDPRTSPLLDAAKGICTGRRADARLAKIEALLSAMAELDAERPTIDLGLVAVASQLGLPPAAGALALFGVGRMAGWIAHIIEQRQQGFMLRPRAHYTGLDPSDL